MNEEKIEDMIERMLKNDEIEVIYAKEEKTEESAKKMADTLTNAVGIAEFIDKNGEPVWGVLINKKDK